MAHLANNPGQQDAGEILLSGFTQMALQMEAQRRLMKPGSKPRRGKKGQKKQPQRGLGVAQLEKIRLEEQRRASQQAQQLAALRQLHTGTPLYAHPNVPTHTSASMIPPFERESNLSSFLMPAPPATSSALAHVPSIDSIASSFLFKNVSVLSSIAHPSTPATPLDLFPSEKFHVASSMKASDRVWTDRNFYIPQAPGEGRALGESRQSLLTSNCNQSNESPDDGGPGYPFLRRNTASTNTSASNLWHHPSQVKKVQLLRFAYRAIYNVNRNYSLVQVVKLPARDSEIIFHTYFYIAFDSNNGLTYVYVNECTVYRELRS